MKKLATLLLAAGMVVAANAPASAADIKIDGYQMFSFERHNSGFDNANAGETTAQRTRLGLKITASENLSGYVQFQMGTDSWGDYSGGNKHGRYNVQTRLSYVDWKLPATSIKVRMGRQTVGLPNEPFGGNAVMGANWGGRDGIAVQAPVADWLGINAFWVRAAATGTGEDADQDNNTDVFGLAAPLKFDGAAVTPWIAYAAFDHGNTIDRGVADTENVKLAPADADLYWAGASATISAFDPFTLKLAAAYGTASYKDFDEEDRDGWYVQAKASYKLAFGTPVLGAWYGSGDDKDPDNAGEGWIPMINGYFTPTTTFYNGGYGLGNDMALENIGGTWGLQAGIEGVSFITDLTHDFTVTWIQGTNHKDNAAANLELDAKALAAYKYLTTEDSVVEFDFNTTYNIYKNLQANLEIAYLINDFGSDYRDAGYDDDDWRVALSFLYKF